MSVLGRIFRLRAFQKEPLKFAARAVQWGVLSKSGQDFVDAASEKYGFTMHLPVGKDGYGSRGFFLVRDYYEPFYEIIGQFLKLGDVFFDCGANQGIYTLAAAKLVGEKGRVFSFEPQPYAVKCLQDNLALNELNNVTIIEAAVSDQKGMVSLDLSTSEVSASIVTDFGGEKTLEVETVRLDDVAKEYAVVPDLIKLDVEGAEYMALQGAADLLKEHKPILVLEVMNPSMEHVKQFHNYLTDMGYKANIIRENELVEIDALTTTEMNVVYKH